MVCARGSREEFEAKRRHSQAVKRTMAEYRKSPQHLFWMELVNRVYDHGFDSVSPQEQYYFAVGVLHGEVLNGGFHQFFSNSSGDHYLPAERGLEVLGAKRALEILRNAKELVFASSAVPAWEARNARLDELEGNEAINAALRVLDDEFVVEDEALWVLLAKYAVDNGFYPPPTGSAS